MALPHEDDLAMSSGITDTHPDAEQVQIQLLRQAGVARRYALACSLTQMALDASRHAIRKRCPACSSQEWQLRFVALCYGEDLAERIRTQLDQRGS